MPLRLLPWLALPAITLACAGGALASGPTSPLPRAIRPLTPLPVDALPESATAKRALSARLADPLPDVLGARVRIDLFAGAFVVGVVDTIERPDGVGLTISGRLEGDDDGSFILARRGDVLAGEVRSRTLGDYELRLNPAGPAGEHVLREIEHTGFRPCGTGPEHEVGGAAPGTSGPGLRLRGVVAPVVDVMVVYTDQARSGAGGQNAIDTIIDVAITQANQVYANSLIGMRINLVYRGRVTYVESNNASTDISRLRGTSDGFMDAVHCMRDRVGADMVAMLVNSFNACGIGYLMTSVGPAFAANAFTVTDTGCVSNFTFAHELGHNMGCAHDRANAGSAAFPYAYGYRTPDNVYRTVMAYAPGQRIAYFSNPNVTFAGYVLGIPAGQPTAADNAQCINNTASTTAAYRPKRVPIDFNRDGVESPSDIFAFLTAYFSPSLTADFDQSGTLAPADIFAYLNTYFVPCPAL